MPNPWDDDAWFPPLLLRDAKLAFRDAWRRYHPRRRREVSKETREPGRIGRAFATFEASETPDRSQRSGGRATEPIGGPPDA